MCEPYRPSRKSIVTGSPDQRPLTRSRRRRRARRSPPMFASTTSSNRAMTVAGVAGRLVRLGRLAAGSASVGRIAPPRPRRRLARGTTRCTSRRTAGCRRCGRPSPDRPLAAARVGIPVRLGERQRAPVQLPARDRHRRRGPGPPVRSGCRTPPARVRRAIAPIAASRRSWIAIEAVAHVEVVDVGRAPAPAAARAPSSGTASRSADGAGATAARAARTAGWSGIGGTVASSISGSCIGASVASRRLASADDRTRTHRSPSRATRCRSSTASRPRRRPRWSPRGSSRTPGPATSSSTCSGAAAGSPGPPSTASAGPSRSSRARSTGCSPRSSCGRPTSATSTPRSRGWPPRRAANRASRSRSATCSRPAARPAAGRSSSTRSSGRSTTRPAIAGRTRPVARALPLHGLSRPARRLGAAPGAARRRRPATGRRPTSAPRRCAPDAARPLPGRRRAPRTCPTSCSTSTRRASSSASARSSSGSRATCAPRPSWPRSASRSSTRSCRPAGSRPQPGPDGCPARVVRPRPAAERHAVPRAQPVARLRGRLPARSAASSSGSRAGRPARSRRGSARTCAASARARRRRSSRLAGPSGLLALARRARTPTAGPARRRGSGSSSASRRCARASTGLAAAYHATSWVLGREAAALLPLDALAGGLAAGAVELAGGRARPGARGGRAGDGPRRPGRPARRRRARGDRRGRARRGVGRLPAARRAAGRPRRRRGGDRRAAAARRRACRPGRGPAPTSASTRCPGGAGDPDMVPAPGLFGAPERFDERPFSAADAARTVTEVAVETLRARGEPARFERLLGEILVGLDRAGQLRRLPRPRRRGPRRRPTAAARRRREADADGARRRRPDGRDAADARTTPRRRDGAPTTGRATGAGAAGDAPPRRDVTPTPTRSTACSP